METNTFETKVRVTCPLCSNSSWKYNAVYTTDLSTGFRTQTNEEIRCGRCGKKANQLQEVEIRNSPEFMDIRQKEALLR